MKLFRIFRTSLLSAVLLLAQGNPYGRITGHLTDSTGGAVPNAAIKSVNLATNVETSTFSNSDGNYDLLNLSPGQYRLTIEAGGFKRYSRSLELRVGDVLNIPATLELGSQTESVTVTAEAPLLDSATASVGHVVDSQRVATLPIPASNVVYLLALSPNMTTNTSPGANWTPDAQNLTGTFIASGAPLNSTEWSVDGMPGTYGGGGLLGIIPPPEMIAEFRTEATYDASLGRSAGAQVVMALKSGTNALHGDLVYAYKGRPLTTHPFFVNRSIYDLSTGPVTPSKISRLWPGTNYNRARGAIGGPLVIPKIYDGRNRTFWEFGFDVMRVPVQNPGFYTVPTLNERSGDFFDLLTAGSRYQIYDPFSAAPAPNGRVSRTPFPGNIIPPSALNPFASKALSYYELPNASGNSVGLNNFIASQNGSTKPSTYLGRVDQTLAANHRMSFSFMELLLHNVERPYFSNITTGRHFNGYWGMAGLDDVVTLRPDTVLETRLSLVRITNASPPNSLKFDLSSLGLPQSLIKTMDPAQTLFPQVAIDGGQYLVLGNEGNSFSEQTFYTLASTISHIRGNHSFRAGIQIRYFMAANLNYGTSYSPSYTFGTSFTQGPLDTSAAAPVGQGLASFLLGLPSGGSTSRPDSYIDTSKNYGWFIQDDWKVSRKLTVNLGLRHEIEIAPTERYDRATRGFAFTTPSPIQVAAQANYAQNPIPQIPASAFRPSGGLLYAGVGGVPRGLFALHPHNFMPRIGLAYQLESKTVVRAGYGVYFDSLGADRANVSQQGFTGTTPLVASLDNGLTFHSTFQNPFPDGLVNPSRSALGLRTFLGNSLSIFDTNRRPAYSQRWNFDVQRELPGRVVVEIGYTGNRATHLGMPRDYDPIPTQYLSTSPVRDQAAINLLSATVPNPFFGIPEFASTSLANPVVPRSQLLKPFPQFAGLTATVSDGFSWYHGASVRVDRRFSHGFTLGAAYTWSKFMEAVQVLNVQDVSPTHVISTSDRPQRIVMSGIYEVPFGKGRRFLSSAPGWANQIVGGWSVTGIYQGQSGSPIGGGAGPTGYGGVNGTPIDFGDIGFTGNVHDIALPNSQRTVDRWFNTNAGFQRDPTQQFGSHYRTFPLRLSGVRADGINVLDISLQKNFYLREHLRFELRADAKNIANHANFAPPVGDPTSSLFGQVVATQGNEQRAIQLSARIAW